MSRLKTAVIGAGHLGRIHTRLLSECSDIDLVAIADPIDETREQISKSHGVPATADYRTLFGKVDAAVVATPTAMHFEICRELISAGIHTFVEKPITFDSATGFELAKIADEKEVVLQVGHVERFNPAWRIAQKHIEAPRLAEFRRTSGFTFRSTDIGVVLDLMIHDIDLALSMADSELMRVQAAGQTVMGGHEDIAHARLEFADGFVANLMASRVATAAERTVTVTGATGQTNVDLRENVVEVIRYDEALQNGFDVEKLSGTEKIHYRDNLFETLMRRLHPVVPPGNAIADEHADFAAAIRTGSSPQVDGRAGSSALAVAERVLSQLEMPWEDQILRRAG